MREATRRGFDRAARRAVLGDGATWIWNLADEHFPDAVQIVDRFHAKQHLSDVAKSIYGATSDLARPWARPATTSWMPAISTPSSPPSACTRRHDDEARKCVDYVERNRARMRYPAFRAAGPVHLDGRRRSRLQGGDRDAAASGPACTGPSPAPTRSSRCAAAS